MKLPRDLSGVKLVQVLCRHFGYRRLAPLRRRNSLVALIPALFRWL